MFVNSELLPGDSLTQQITVPVQDAVIVVGIVRSITSPLINITNRLAKPPGELVLRSISFSNRSGQLNLESERRPSSKSPEVDERLGKKSTIHHGREWSNLLLVLPFFPTLCTTAATNERNSAPALD